MTLDEVKEKFHFDLPEKLIAKKPHIKRDSSKLLYINRKEKTYSHHRFSDISNLLSENDVLVFNQSKVFPARLYGNKQSGGRVEVLLLNQESHDTWQAISKPGLKTGTRLYFPQDVAGNILTGSDSHGELSISFSYPHKDFFTALFEIGNTPLPHYITITLEEKDLRKRYQSVFAKDIGSAAAPTASLHFTNKLLSTLKAKGIQQEFITLHVGLGTFQSLREENIQKQKLHEEYFSVSPDTVYRLNKAKRQGKRIIAVGTTAVRTLETLAQVSGELSVVNKKESTEIFIYPPYTFRFVDSMITNFHLPESSLLMLVSAFCVTPGTNETVSTFNQTFLGKAYEEAIAKHYRFFSFGDAMFIV